MDTQRSCLICSAPSLYAHFGVNSCRSCADFFKRGTTKDRPYSCRQGDGKCTMNPNDRHNCRGCRFKKCLANGMKVDSKSPNSVTDPVDPTQAGFEFCQLPEINPTHQRSCLICTAPSLYAHWGITSCRSCAEFYKRTIVSGRTFTCRQGEGKCTINPRDRHNCRGCRFRKCEALGMNFDPKNADLMPDPSRDQSEKTYLEERSLSSVAEEAKATARPSGFIDHTTFFNYEPSESSTPLLDKIVKGYSIMCLTRMSAEKKFASGSSKQIQADNLVLYRSSYSTMIPIYLFLNDGIMELGNFAFDQFKHYSADTKKTFVERRLTCLDILESTYRAWHLFPDCRETRMPGYTTYFTNSDVDEVFETCDDHVDKPKLIGEWKKAVTQLSRMVRYHFEIVKPTDHEFAALLGLAFWNNVYSDDLMTNTANKVWSDIIRELHVYYKEQGIADVAIRFGQLFCLLVNSEECSVKVDEDYEVFRLMNMFEHSHSV